MNWSIFGYMSNGESVPDVMTTELNRSNTGLIAMAGSRHLQTRSAGPSAELLGSDIRKMENWVRNGRVFGLERLQDEQEACANSVSMP